MTTKNKNLLWFTVSFFMLLALTSAAFVQISNSSQPAYAACIWGGMGLFAALTIALKALFK
jgi:hypothetical protein